jgi:ACS family glucarate transporter-like MFS transporter
MPIRWLLICWIFAISAISFIDRVNISIAARFIQQEFHITDVQLGPVFSAFLLGYALFQAAGRLADRFGPRLVVALGTVWWGIFTALTAMVSAHMAHLLLLLLAIRFTLGAGEAVLFPASNRLVANWIPSRERGLANGIIFAGVGAGAGITPPLVTYIVLHYGWRASFWISAVMGLAAGAVWYWLALDHASRDRAHRAGIARAALRARNRQAAALAHYLRKQGRAGDCVQLLHLRLCRLDLLRLVLQIP